MLPPVDILLPIFSPLMAIIMWNMCYKGSRSLVVPPVGIYEPKMDQLVMHATEGSRRCTHSQLACIFQEDHH
jgi:hypothetical protein